MKELNLKYNQSIHAKITRIYDSENEKYYFVRNDTKIIFGNGGKLLGTVIMSNPGSFEFKYDPKWEWFKNGGGTEEIFESSKGTPDPTMINIIKAIESAYSSKNTDIPDGYIRIYNLSSVRCSKGKEALEKHNIVKELLIENGADIALLEDPAIYNENNFKEICHKSNFIIMGFLKKFLNDEALRIIKWIDKYSENKKIIAPSKDGYPYHPIVWIKLKNGNAFNDIVSELLKVI